MPAPATFMPRLRSRLHHHLAITGIVISTAALCAPAAHAQLERRNPEERLLAQTATPLPSADGARIIGSAARPDPEQRLLAQTSAPAASPAAPAPSAPSSSSSTEPSASADDAQRPAGPGGAGAGGPGGGGPRRPGFGPPGGGFGGRRPGGGGGAFGGPGPGGAAGAGGGGATLGAPGSGAGFLGVMGGTAETFTIEGDQVTLQFPNNPVVDLLSIYERLTNKTLVKDTNIFEGATISLMTPKPVQKDEAVRLIEAALLTNGYAIVADPDGKSARILPTRGQGVQQMQFSAGVRLYSTDKDLPTGETLVTYFMKLDYLDPTQASEILANHVGLNVYGRITPVTTPPGLLITESATIVRQLIAIRAAIDMGNTGSQLVTKFIPLTYADSSVVAQIIQSTLNAQATEREQKGVKTVRGEAQPGRSKEGEKSESRSERREEPKQAQPIFYNGQWVYPPSGSGSSGMPSTQVVADTRLNQILVVATPEDFTYVASLIAEFDKPLTIDPPYERKLNYASAVDVLPALVDLLKDSATGTTQLPGGGTLQAGTSSQTTTSTSRSQLLGGRSTQNTRGGSVASSASGASNAVSADGTTTGGTSTGVGGRADTIQGPTEDNAPVSVLVNKTRIVADPMSNSVFVIGRKEEAKKIDALLDKLDQKPAQVYLSTVIGQLSIGDGFEFGVDFLTKTLKDGSNSWTSSKITKREDIITGKNITDIRDNLITSAIGPASGFNLYGTLGQSFEGIINALDTSNHFKILSRPSVFALNNKKAVITSGSQIPVPSQSISVPGNQNTTGSVTTTVAYRDVVLKLEVVPLINADGEVSLTISQVNDTVTGTQRVEPNDVPIIGTEQLVTTITVPDGHTIVLGGLISDEKKKDTSGLPGISRIPLLGNLFKDHKDTNTRKELIIFIQPHVVKNNTDVVRSSYNEDIRTGIGAEAAKKFPTTPAQPEPSPDTPPKKKSFFGRLFSRPDSRPASNR
ncbi:MAG: hypothetical protein K1X78_22570 [Verrucomicrobiaceae bacterium]|nr:hypothetical protein [Verrucomicrobiaceae bacterium]